MKRDEVMALSDEDLRVKAAELTGWRFDVYVESDNSYEDSFHTIAPDGMIRDLVPDYPNDTAAAMDLALSIGDKYWMELHTAWRIGDPCFAGFTPLGTTGWNGRPDNQCEAEKPAKAIVRAFVLAMTQED